MEVAMGGGSSSNMDDDWESICGILSMDQDSSFSNLLGFYPHQHPHPSSDDSQGLLSLLMEDANDSIFTSPFAQYYTQQAIPSLNTTPQLMSCSSTTSLDDLNNHSSCEVAKSYHDDDNYDQVFEFPIIKGSNTHRRTTKRTCDHLETRPNQILPPKKKARVAKNVGKGKRNTQPPKSVVRKAKVEEDRKSSCDESNAFEESSIMESNDKKRAMRGCATDPQSLYARKRRDRINERLKILQSLVPNGTKVDISTMLEDALHYVKFMQLQIKLLSSDEMWMYAPLAYHGFDVGHNNTFW